VRAATAGLNNEFSGRSVARMPLAFVCAFLAFVLRLVLRRPRDSMAAGVAGFAAVAILVNALYLQSGPHPAPIFANKPVPVVVPPTDAAAATPQRKAADVKVEMTRSRSDMVAEIQRELLRRGFYEGVADGVYGPKTDTAIRDFEQMAGLRPSAEPNDILLASIARSAIKAQPVPIQRNDPIAALLAPSPRIVAVQRALTDFGYGPVKPTGLYDTETRSAIERFEKARRRPLTGQISDLLVRDLAALTGRPLE
jgi:peptidoglycan hydrolase-like protein with peptidoglycan-binding domain